MNTQTHTHTHTHIHTHTYTHTHRYPPTHSLAFTLALDGKCFVGATKNGAISVFDTETGEAVRIRFVLTDGGGRVDIVDNACCWLMVLCSVLRPVIRYTSTKDYHRTTASLWRSFKAPMPPNITA